MTMIDKRRPLPGEPIRRGPARPARPGRPSAGAAKGLTSKEALRILRRRWLMITIFLVSFSVFSVIGTIFWRRTWPQYEAFSIVTVSPPKRSMLTDSPIRNTDIMDRYRRSAANQVKLQQVLRDALDSEEMQDTDWYRKLREGDAERVALFTELDEELGVALPPESDHIKISLSMVCSTTQQKEQLPTIVNQVTEAFVDSVNYEQENERNREISTMQGELVSKETELRTLKTDIGSRIRKTEVPVMRRQVDSLSMELRELITTNNDLLTQRADLEKNLTTMMRQRRQGNLANNPMILRALEADPILRALEQNLTASSAEMENVQSKYGPSAQQHKRLRIQIAGLQRETDQRRAQLAESNIDSFIAFYEQELSKVLDLLQTNGDRLDGLTQKRRDLNNALFAIEDLEAQAEGLKEEIRVWSSRLTDARLVKKGLPATIVARAQVPLQPEGPMYKVWIPLGVVIGLAFGVAVAFLVELMDTSLKTPTDVAIRSELPLLALVPHADDLDDDIEDYRLACLGGGHSMVTEGFREMWTNLQFSGPAEKRRTLLITSPSPDDGRTCVAANLAITIAQSGRRVLLIDANFRRPAIRGLFDGVGEAGLSDVLSGQATWNDCVQETEVPNLTVLHAGQMPPNPTELLGSDLARTLLAELGEQYDQVLVDGPPLLLVSDARVIASQVDGVIVVVRAGVNTYGIIQRSRRCLNDIGAHILGGVLNGVRTTAGGYLRKNYDAFHEYQEMEA